MLHALISCGGDVCAPVRFRWMRWWLSLLSGALDAERAPVHKSSLCPDAVLRSLPITPQARRNQQLRMIGALSLMRRSYK